MSDIVSKIANFLRENPSSRAKVIAKALGEEKSVINKHLYANEHVLFSKEGLTPPLWRNLGDFCKIDLGDEVLTFEESAPEADFEDKENSDDDDLLLLDSESQLSYLELYARIARGEVMDRSDRRKMNQIKDQARLLKSSAENLHEKEKRRVENRHDYFKLVDNKVSETWPFDEQRLHAVAALTIQLESNLRKLAFGYLTSSSEKLFDDESESEIETRQAKSISILSTVSSTLEARLNSLEKLTDEELVVSSVRFAWWMRSDRSIRPTPKLAMEIFPGFEESEIVKTFRSRFQEIISRIKKC